MVTTPVIRGDGRDVNRRELERAHGIGVLTAGLDVDGALGVLTLAWHGLMVLARSGEPSEQLLPRSHAAADVISARVRAPSRGWTQ